MDTETKAFIPLLIIVFLVFIVGAVVLSMVMYREARAAQDGGRPRYVIENAEHAGDDRDRERDECAAQERQRRVPPHDLRRIADFDRRHVQRRLFRQDRHG